MDDKCQLYWIPVSAVTNHHKLIGLKHINLFSYNFVSQKPKMKVLAGLLLLRISRGNMCPYLFQILEGCLYFLACDIPLYKPAVSSLPSDLLSKDSGSPSIIQDNIFISKFLITYSNSLLPCKLTYSQVWELRHGHLWENNIHPTTPVDRLMMWDRLMIWLKDNGVRFLRKLDSIKSKSKGGSCFVYGVPYDLLRLSKDIEESIRQLRGFSLK